MKKAIFTKIGNIKSLENNKRLIKLLCRVKDIIDLSEEQITIIKLEDDTGVIEARIFGDDEERKYQLNNVNIGDTVLVIGEIRKWVSDIYVKSKALKKLTAAWEMYYSIRLKRFKNMLKSSND